MPDKYIIQRRTASGLETVAELPALEGGKVDLSWLPVVGSMGSAIIERGSNANGEYVRWADGTQITYASAPISGAFDSILVEPWRIANTSTIAFPASFVQAPTIVCSVMTPGAYSLVSRIFPSATGFYVLLLAAASVAFSDNATCRYLAIGRWK